MPPRTPSSLFAVATLLLGTWVLGAPPTPQRARAGSGDGGLALPEVEVAELAARPESDWSRLLPQLLPTIFSCLRQGATAGSAVAGARYSADGAVTVRLRSPKGERFDCEAAADGEPVESFTAVAEGAPPLPGEGQPLFYPAPELTTAPPVPREGLRALVDADGTLLGWLSAPPPPGERPGDRP